MTELEREEPEFEAEIGEKEPVIDGDIAAQDTFEGQALHDTLHTREDITSVHIDDIGEQQWSDEDMIGKKIM